VDWEIIDKQDPNSRGLISCKYQGTSGTAEEKMAYEVIKLLHTMKIDNRYKKSWIIMGGEGWSIGMREFIKNHLSEWIPEMGGRISILTTDQLISSEISLN
jgi:flavorubredoxin